eukprot:TRINITY_DN1551_c0_g1_i4.p4 TRINITY_DN1551_c0_g1~~TRINITY_DN1551_c0_g1_i4.p4  ORF type:complete len:109 (+),score=3.92 TRINITY_DN1551_c0_g1_i4:148-474(+)
MQVVLNQYHGFGLSTGQFLDQFYSQENQESNLLLIIAHFCEEIQEKGYLLFFWEALCLLIFLNGIPLLAWFQWDQEQQLCSFAMTQMLLNWEIEIMINVKYYLSLIHI